MANGNTHTRSILKNDPAFEGLDFASLRAEGINHLAEFSGKIWTDHNVHDPGITMLELLCYALIDLGYRTRLPAEDVLSRDPSIQTADDNFYTPAQVLTCNPVTIMDFRKLLIDIKEVKNAWVEVHEEWINCNADQPASISVAFNSTGDVRSCNTFLNGLYKVYIELYSGPYVPEFKWTKKEKAQIEEIVEKVRSVLMAHRNLCEDFVSITILCKEKIGVCADIELEQTADAEKTYVEIIEVLRAFFSPDPRYYTLAQMLEKGKPIDEIFAGRPFLKESHGFVDAGELEGIPFRKEIHVSDVYNALFGIKGIRTIKKLRLRNCNSPDNSIPGECDWKYFLQENHTAEFSLECSGLRFSRNSMPVGVNENKYRDFFRLNYSFSGKILHTAQLPALDLRIPSGIYHADLGKYISIQNEMPRVYGISEGGIADNVSPLRKSQALQLKGYLLFFDQLLSNYLAQLSQIRNLFAFRNNENIKATYFSSLPLEVPDVQKLLRFGSSGSNVVGGQGDILVIPVHKNKLDEYIEQGKLKDADIENAFERIEFVTATDRDAAVYGLIDDLQNRNFIVQTIENAKGCWFFYIITQSDQVALLSRKYYPDKKLADLAATNVSYIGTFITNYRKFTHIQTSISSFEIELNLSDYPAYLQQMAEDKTLYLERKAAFMDHLLSRFAESFTDFALLSYNTLNEEELKQQNIRHKNNYLSSYESLGRNRGRAYDYKVNGWNRQNISGFEERVKALAGINNCGQGLCHFEVHEYTAQFYWLVSAADKNIFRSTSMFDSVAEAATDLGIFIASLKNETVYENAVTSFHDKPSSVTEYDIKESFYPAQGNHPHETSVLSGHLKQLLQGTPGTGDIFVSDQVYKLQLVNNRNEVIRTSKQIIESQSKALSATRSLLRKVNDEEWEAVHPVQQKLELKAAKEDPSRLVDISHFTKNVRPCPEEYKWILCNEKGDALFESSQTYASGKEAVERMLNELTSFEVNENSISILSTEEGSRLQVHTDDGMLLAVSPVFNEESERTDAIRFIIEFSQKEKNDSQYTYKLRDACHWEVAFDNGLVFQSMALLADQDNAMNSWRKHRHAFRVAENYSWDWDEEGQQRLSVKDETESVIARLIAGTEQNGLAEDIFNAIQLSLNEKKFRVTTVKTDEGFGFSMRDNDGLMLLSGYEVYKSRGAAFLVLLRALEKGRMESMYLKSGDEGNHQFTFFLKNDDQQFLAEHPFFYDSPMERDQVLHNTISFLQNKQRPAKEEKQDIRFGYALGFEGRELFTSVQKFRNAREASENATQVLILASLAENYRYDKEPASGEYILIITQGNQVLAKLPDSYANETIAEGAMSEIIQAIGSQMYHVQLQTIDYKWQFRISLGLGNNRAQFQSDNEYDNPDDVLTAFSKMSMDVNSLKIHRSGEQVQLTSKFRINKLPVTASAFDMQSGASAETALAVSQALYQLVTSENKKALQRWVKKDESTGQGNWVYRLVNKGDYYAYHLNCKEGKDYSSQYIKSLHASVNGQPDYLLLCHGPEIVRKRKDPVTGIITYHYLIKARNIFYPADPGKELVLFISTQGFVSHQDALRSFEDNYLLILKRASKSLHYGNDRFISLTEIIRDDGACRMNADPVVYVPKETLEIFFGSDTDKTIKELVEMAKSYPIRLSGKNGYKFSFYDYKKKFSYFISSAIYQSPVEAMKAFLILLVLIKSKRNFYHYCDPDTGNTFIVIREVLLESRRRFLTQDDAWGQHGLEKLIGVSQTKEAFHISVNPDDCCFSFFVACKSKIIHPCTYDTQASRDKALQKLKKDFSDYQLPILPELKPSSGQQFEIWYKGKLLAMLPSDMQDLKNGICHSGLFDLLEAILNLGPCVDIDRSGRFVIADENDKVLAYLDNPLFTREEWISELVDMAGHFPVYRKDNSYYFRIPYPGKPEDVTLADPCGCGEQLPTEPASCYTAWSGGCYNSCEEAFAALHSLREKFRNENNYHPVFDCICGSYRIEFIEEDEVIAFNPQCYPNRELVCDAVDKAQKLINCEGMHLVEHILLRPRCPEHCECLIPDCPDPDCRFIWEAEEKDPCKPEGSDPCFIPGKDPYSCIATVILPAWPQRFNTLASRDLVNRILYREAPSHILLRILWVSPKDLCAIESNYKLWLRWLANKNNYCGKPFDHCSFINLLFNTRLDCWWPQDYCETCSDDHKSDTNCVELNNQEDRGNACNITVNDVYCWNTPDCCFEYNRIDLSPEKENEKMKLIRKRTSAYLEKLGALQEEWAGDKNIGRALSYVKGNKPDEEKLIRIAKLFSETDNLDEEQQIVYREIKHIMLAFYLDRSLLDQYDSQKLSDIKRTIRKVDSQHQDLLHVFNRWNTGNELKNFVHVKTFQALKGIMKRN